MWRFTWIPIALVPVVAMLAFVVIADFRGRADAAHHSQVALGQLEVQLNRENALEWRVVGSRKVDAEAREQLTSIRAGVSAHVRALGIAIAGADKLAIVTLIRSYEAAFDSELVLIERQAFVEADAFDESVVDPSFERLSERLAELNEKEAAEAATAIRRASVGTGASLAGAVLLLLLLFWRFHHDRRRLLRERSRELSKQALQDSLTDLPNRRKLMVDLEEAVVEATVADPRRLVMFDLDGFKTYNDTFGHPEGDLLLRRLARRFAAAVDGHGTAYRLGGDEFCALMPGSRTAVEEVVQGCCDALAESGQGFTIRTSFGTASIPTEAPTASDALHLADQRMYSDKGSERLSARQQTLSLALKILAVQQPTLGQHSSGVATLARAVGERLAFDKDQLDEIERAAEVHDFGKIAIPHSILTKEGPLDDDEWCFMRRHTLIGENMLQAAPALASIGRLVRSSHERVDGAGYPDGLHGDDIPLASRIIFVCDAYDAMTTPRSYRSPLDDAAAVEELRRNAGTQFDPMVVEAFCDVLQAATPTPAHRGAVLAAA